MGKPWAKTEIDFINHPKFRALNANAICLWIEGKNYCDKHMTDGLIPKHIVKQFRFSGQRAVESLLSSCGPKGAGAEGYAPLWELHDVGFKMHSYLDYNDCREVVVARLERLDAERDKDKDRKAQARAAKQAKRAGHPTGHSSDVQPESGGSLTLDSIQSTATDPLPKNGNGGSAPPALRPRSGAPIHDTSHRKHAVCGRVCLHASLFNDFIRRRNHDDADREIRTWAEGVVDAWTTGAFQTIEPGDSFDFWKARYAETWPVAAAASQSKLPEWVQKARANG